MSIYKDGSYIPYYYKGSGRTGKVKRLTRSERTKCRKCEWRTIVGRVWSFGQGSSWKHVCIKCGSMAR